MNDHVLLGSSVWTGIQPGVKGELKHSSGLPKGLAA
jgi:hypothetical protein